MNGVEADKQQEVADGEPGKAIMRGLPAVEPGTSHGPPSAALGGWLRAERAHSPASAGHMAPRLPKRTSSDK
jgi:hypothetical protein